MSDSSSKLRDKLPDIIHRPDLQTRRQRSVTALFTGLGWMIWLYLFMPLATLGGWFFGVERFQTYVIDNAGRSWASLTIYAITIGLAGVALLVWAFYNYRRFRHVDRRRPADAVTPERLAQSFGIDVEQIAGLQRQRTLVVEHDERGEIVAVTRRASPSPPA
ncbi:poly-beta-1,6-N-acetyl-D-glucosamine biosynthesis protein PgaD [Salinicola halophilus]|uniref:poly-beta-1,6-N-acetyl-D-glucosamine biosynthesis protein PgaD n=1 Tax=Salinicola halophilus TaxID=184065 RepID=UPI000DA1B23E|nr:poly-beta-1,6-N-acetyl-D-glucosamine biosynthesis protein PgaD [Salinicola halophilus]